ncbi:hypothetical protein LINGRAHAP2_LOCUS11361, partial [Linum grandiflorum]
MLLGVASVVSVELASEVKFGTSPLIILLRCFELHGEYPNSLEDIGTKFCPKRPELCKIAVARRAEHMAQVCRRICQSRIFSGSLTARHAGG